MKINGRVFFRLPLAVLLAFCLGTAAASAQESSASKSFFYTGELNYSKPASFGWLGYSNPGRTVAIPPSQEGTAGASGGVSAPSGLSGAAGAAGLSAPSDLSGVETRSVTRTAADGSFASTAVPPTFDENASGEIVYRSDAFQPSDDVSADDRVGIFLLEPRPVRESFFQGFAASMGYLPNTGDAQSGMTTLEGAATFGFPFPDSEHPLLLTPDIEWTDFTFPDAFQYATGEKASLYSTGGEVRTLLPLNERLMIDLAVGAHWNSDFSSSDSDSLRITGRGCAIVKTDASSRLIFGAAYSDISDWTVVPIAGILLKPSEDLLLDLYFPRPKIAKRLTCCKDPKGETPYWAYLAGELDGNRWTFRSKETAFPRDYEMTYYDWKLLAGIERRVSDEINWAVEGGLVFGRHLKIEPLGDGYGDGSAGGFGGETHPETTGVVRLKIMY